MATDITVTEDVTTVTVTESTTAIDISPQVTSVGVSAVDITAANIASSISLTPTGNISATNVQAGFNELASEVAFLSGADFTGDVTISNGELTVNGKVEAELFQGDIDGAIHFKGAVASGATLTKGDVVYISGHSGQKTEVDKADASDSNKMPAFGIVAADPVGQNVDVVTFGTLKTINTSAYSEGDELFVSTTAGQLTSTAPSGEGNLVQKIAKVVRAGVSGNIKIMGAGRTNATPNLNNGNIFIGDSNNQATTVSFATQVASADITESQITDLQSYLTDYTVTELDVKAHEAAIQITESQITNLQSYLTTETDPVFSAHAASGVTSTKISQWDTAYDWGDHADAGYLTSIANGSIDTDQLADDAVTAAKIADGVIIGTSGTQKIDDGTLEIALEKDNAAGFPDYNIPILNLTTIENRASGKMLTFSENEAEITNSTAALGKVPYASYGSLFIGVNNCGLHMSSSFSNVIFPCDARGEHNNNTISLGASSQTFKDIYATDTTINTSDRNKKQDITALSDAETNVAIACKGLLKKYKWKQSVEEKGGDARWHFGIIAQELETAFADQGLDASDYGVFIKEEVETDGVTETHYAIRYNELLAFIVAAI